MTERNLKAIKIDVDTAFTHVENSPGLWTEETQKDILGELKKARKWIRDQKALMHSRVSMAEEHLGQALRLMRNL